MDDAWLQAAHEAYEWGHSQGVLTQPPSSGPVASLSSEDVREPSPLLDGQPPAQWAAEYASPLQLPQPHREPFRRMLAHPAVLSRLEWMLGRGYRLWNPPTARETPIGGTGQQLHGGLGWSQRGVPADFHSYHFAHGRSNCESVNVAWQLCDQGAGDGGFCVLPGSAKGQYEVPQSMHHFGVLPVSSRSHCRESKKLSGRLLAVRTGRPGACAGQGGRRGAVHGLRVHPRGIRVAGQRRAARRLLPVPLEISGAAGPGARRLQQRLRASGQQAVTAVYRRLP